MLEPTKMPYTETVMGLTVSCPATAYPAVLDFLRNAGCTIEDDDLEVPTSSPGDVFPKNYAIEKLVFLR